MQNIIVKKGGIGLIPDIVGHCGHGRCFIVCRHAIEPIREKILDSLNSFYYIFNQYSPNPKYEEVCHGVRLFQDYECDCIIAVGGGSAIDVAKCIKLFAKMDSCGLYYNQNYKDNRIPLIAVPTTAGTGSESTQYAVIYHEGEKVSIAHESIIPDYAILDLNLLDGLSDYHKKCAIFDALSQAIESWWSIHAADESICFSKKAIRLIDRNLTRYLSSRDDDVYEKMLLASNYAGRAINITQTTAAHAMSYKLTTLYQLPHGHAVILCLPHVWRYMLEHMDDCVDIRGKEYLAFIFLQIAESLNCTDVKAAIRKIENLICVYGLRPPMVRIQEEFDFLANSVNVRRLQNNPVKISTDKIRQLYRGICYLQN